MDASRRQPARVAVADLIDRYGGVLIDAFGVLVDGRGALPGADALLARLEQRSVPYLIVTNDASRRDATNAERFRRFGLAVTPQHFLSSGDLDRAPLRRARTGRRALPRARHRRLAAAGGRGGRPGVPDRRGRRLRRACVVCDDDGFPFLDGINAALSALFRAFDAGRAVELVLPNPDLLFPAGDGAYGFTSGAIALLLETALARRYPDEPPRFTRLGKPHRPIFDEAARRLGTGELLMIGDQLETDIAGALGAGIDAALVVTGVTRWQDRAAAGDIVPTYLLDSLA